MAVVEITKENYETEVLPTIPDKFSPAAKITENDFRRILNEFKEEQGLT